MMEGCEEEMRWTKAGNEGVRMERNPYLRKERQHDGGQEGKMLNAALRSNEDKLVEKSKDRRRTEDRRKNTSGKRKLRLLLSLQRRKNRKQEEKRGS